MLGSILLTLVVFSIITSGLAYAEKRECEDYHGKMKWDSTDHKDSKESKKEFKQSMENDTLCEAGKKIDHEEIQGTIKDFKEFKDDSSVYLTSKKEQKECEEEAFKLGDSLADYELEYCSWDQD